MKRSRTGFFCQNHKYWPVLVHKWIDRAQRAPHRFRRHGSRKKETPQHERATEPESSARPLLLPPSLIWHRKQRAPPRPGRPRGAPPRQRLRGAGCARLGWERRRTCCCSASPRSLHSSSTASSPAPGGKHSALPWSSYPGHTWDWRECECSGGRAKNFAGRLGEAADSWANCASFGRSSVLFSCWPQNIRAKGPRVILHKNIRHEFDWCLACTLVWSFFFVSGYS
jgi:hypothetical protein